MYKYIVVYKYPFSKRDKIHVSIIEADNPQEAANIFHTKYTSHSIIKIFLYEEAL